MSNRHPNSWLILALILGVGLLHGVTYVFSVPPWQHNDEPNHFEYAWLVAHRSTLPGSADYDPGMSRAVMTSMAAHHFFDGMGYIPDLAPEKLVRITGYSQLSDPPLYYLLASIPLRLVAAVDPNARIETQLYAARLASLALLLISLLAVWGWVGELTDPSNPLRFVAPFTLALWPGFIDMMTAVTDLAGAVAFFSIFIWFCVRLVRRGLNGWDLTGAVLSTAACLWTQVGVYVAAPLWCAALLLAVFRGRGRWGAWGLLFSGILISFLAVLTWGDADLWYRETWQVEPTRVKAKNSPLGTKAFHLVVPSQGPPAHIYQLIPPSSARDIEINTVTLGAWMWASRPVEVRSPILQIYDGNQQYSGVFTVTEIPVFHAITVTLTGDIARSWIMLSLPMSAEHAGVDVFFDGVVLAEGAFPLNESPDFENQNARRGLWGGQPFENLVRNPSAEIGGPRIRLWADRALSFIDYERPSMVLYALRDWSGAGWYFRGTAANLFRTMWGRFGWNHVPFLGHKPYRFFLAVTILGVMGLLGAVWRWRKNLSWDLAAWLGMAVLLLGAMVMASGVFYLWFKPFMPSARYLSPILPIIVFTLCAGWWELLRALTRRLRAWVPTLIYGVFFLGVAVYALVSLAHYYYG